MEREWLIYARRYSGPEAAWVMGAATAAEALNAVGLDLEEWACIVVPYEPALVTDQDLERQLREP